MRTYSDCNDFRHHRPDCDGPVGGAIRGAFLIRRTCRYRWLLMTVWNPRQVATQDVDCERPSHEDSTYPKAPVTVHPSPVRARIWLSAVAAVSFGVVFVAGQISSIAAEYSPRRAAWLQRAR
jgi:hypothetical protein